MISALCGCDAEEDGSDVPDPCGPSEFYDEYVPGIDKAGERLHVTLDRARPAPPEKGDNTWELTVTDLDGEPVDEVEIALFPFMPDHGHGTSVDPVVTSGDDAGEFVVDDIRFVMGGRWEVTLTLDDGAASPDEVVFDFCVPD